MNRKILIIVLLSFVVLLLLSLFIPFVHHKANVIFRLSKEKITDILFEKEYLELNYSNYDLLDLYNSHYENKNYFELAKINSYLSQETFNRLLVLSNSWIEYKNPKTRLIPYKLGWGNEYNLWRPDQSTSDFFPFLLMSTYFTNKSQYNDLFSDTDIIKKANYENGLPAMIEVKSGKLINKNQVIDYHFDNQIFGASEIVKDGMLPLIEYFGKNDWSYEYATYLIETINENCYINTSFGCIPSKVLEVNGEMLISLSRLYRITNNDEYIRQGLPIFKSYILKLIPESNFLPCEEIDLYNFKCKSSEFSIGDHSNEIIFGLVEFYSIIKGTEYDNEIYHNIIRIMLEKLKNERLNEEGFWTNHGQVVDTFGYVHNAYLLYSKIEDYDVSFINKSLKNLDNVDLVNFKVVDDQSDFIESVIYLQHEYNLPEVDLWISKNMLNMMSNQNSKGMFMEDYKDGNVGRTMLMFLLYKTQGISVENWNSDINLGSYKYDGELYVYLESDDSWEGTIYFDEERSLNTFNIKYYPRINSFPEWFTINEDKEYEITMSDNALYLNGKTIIKEGISVNLTKNETFKFIIKEVS
ncbi:hypothetical protein HN415_01295 [Candidatus Woesearchaeota archaeon]|jgi:hypothetical protein|nr:hypothetical protein [Candidatus Woesearchaeota archaeon]